MAKRARSHHRRLGVASVLALAAGLLTGCSTTVVPSETPDAFDADTFYCGQFFAAHGALTALAGMAASGQVDVTAAQEAMPAVQSGFVPLLDPAVGEENDVIAAIQAAATAAVELTELPDFTSEAMVLPEEFEHAMMQCESAGAAPIIIGEGG